MSHKHEIPELTEEAKAKILEGQTEQQQLGLKAHWALIALGNFFERRGDQRYYKINALLRQLEIIWQHNDVSESV